ncbi:MAG: exodeoxyribonuclease VII small subunit [Bacteriovoracaceae bacterium]|nr:exodeoxyribonuclease VII small subunit [Bacteriovoracaceae bacterium]
MTGSVKNFEEQLNKLEEIVGELESGNLSLDESLKKFEKGMELYKGCKQVLDSAEKKIKVLTESLLEKDLEVQSKAYTAKIQEE